MEGSKIRLVLASASPRREALLRQIGFCPEVRPSKVEEENRSSAPAEVVMDLSRQKAKAVAGSILVPELSGGGSVLPDSAEGISGAVTLGADTVVFAGGRILGKPADEGEAYRMLHLLQGGCHQVFTGVTLIREEQERTFYEKTDVWVYPMSPEEIQDYIAAGESLDKAGAYGIQGSFAAYIRRIEGSYTNVIGLPVGRVYQEIKQLMEERV